MSWIRPLSGWIPRPFWKIPSKKLKFFAKNKFDSKNKPKADSDCALGVQTVSNQHNERNYEFYCGYKNHVLVDCITGLPVGEMTTTTDVEDSTVALDILKKTDSYLSVEE